MSSMNAHYKQGLSLEVTFIMGSTVLHTYLPCPLQNIHQAMMTLRDLQELPCSTSDLNQVPDLIYTLRKASVRKGGGAK